MQTNFTRRAIIIINASVAALLNGAFKRVANNLDPQGGDKTFTVSLSATGDEPATHYWCSTALTETQWTKANQLCNLAAVKEFVQVFDGNTTSADEALTQTGLKRMQSII